jgi:hypothetical protein
VLVSPRAELSSGSEGCAEQFINIEQVKYAPNRTMPSSSLRIGKSSSIVDRVIRVLPTFLLTYLKFKTAVNAQVILDIQRIFYQHGF